MMAVRRTADRTIQQPDGDKYFVCVIIITSIIVYIIIIIIIVIIIIIIDIIREEYESKLTQLRQEFEAEKNSKVNIEQEVQRVQQSYETVREAHTHSHTVY